MIETNGGNEIMPGEASDYHFILKSIMDLTGHLSKVERLSEKDSFLELGIGSVLGVLLIEQINTKFCFQLGPETIYDFPTPEKLARWLSTRIQPRGDLDRSQEILEILAKFVRETVLIKEFDVKKNFIELGLNSVQGVELIDRVNNTFSLKLGAETIYDYYTPEKLALHIYDQLNLKAGKSDPEVQITEEANTKPDNRNLDDVAVIGMSGRFAGSRNLEEFWEHIKNGDCCVEEIRREGWNPREFFDPDLYRRNTSISKWAGLIEDIDRFDCLFFRISPQEAQRMDPQQRLFLEECIKTIENAGYCLEDIAGRKIGVYVGARASDYKDRSLQEIEVESKTFLGTDLAILSGRISYFLDLTGPNLTVDTACSSSLVAVHLACESIRNGETEMAVAGGVFVMPSPEFLVLSSKTEMLSPEGKCKSFDQSADGIVLGEGVGAIILKSLRHALKDRDFIQAVIKGSGLNQDGQTNGITAPSLRSQVSLLRETYKRSGIHPDTIGYIEAHGTGTKLGDPIEVKALTTAFREFTSRREFCYLGTHKPNFGHSIMTAGLAGLFKIILAIRNRFIPPNIHMSQLNEHIQLSQSPFRIEKQGREWQSRDDSTLRAGVSSFGFSGTNCHVIVEDVSEIQRISEKNSVTHLFPFSAKSKEALHQKMVDFKGWINSRDELPQTVDIAYTLACGRSHYDWRCCIVAKNLEKLHQQLEAVLQKKEGDRPLYCGVNPNKKGVDMNTSDEIVSRLVYRLTGECKEESTLKDYCTLAESYEKGANVKWKLFFTDKGRRIPLPGYPFQGERHWFKAKRSLNMGLESVAFFKKMWVENNPVGEFTMSTKAAGRILVMGYDRDELDHICTGLADAGMQNIVSVRLDLKEQVHANHNRDYRINPSQKQHYRDIFQELTGESQTISSILFIGKQSMAGGELSTAVDKSINLGPKALFILAKSILESTIKSQVKLLYLFQTEALSSDVKFCTQALQSAASGMLKTIHQEIPNVIAQAISMDPASMLSSGFFRQLAMELQLDNENAAQIRYRGNRRYIARYYSDDLGLSEIQAEPAFTMAGKVFLITGGTGRLGRLFTRYLASLGKVKIVVNGRRRSDRHIQSIIDDAACPLAEIVYLQSDITRREEVETLIAEIRNRFGSLHGIFHCAGISRDAFLLKKSVSDFDEVLASKVWGTIWLDQCTRNEPLEYFVLFSSIAAALGNIGQADYAYANAFLDNFANLRAQLNRSGRTISINWPLWEAGGIHMDREEFQTLFGQSGLQPLPSEMGLRIWEKISKISENNFLVSFGDTEVFQQYLHQRSVQTIQQSMQKRISKNLTSKTVNRAVTRNTKAEWGLLELFGSLFELPVTKFQKDTNFQEYGLDSIMVNRFNAEIERLLQAPLSRTLLYEYTTFEELFVFLSENYNEALCNAFGNDKASSSVGISKSGNREVVAKTQVEKSISERWCRNANPSIAIVGISGRYPQAKNLDEFWNCLKSGKDCVGTVPLERWDVKKLFDPDPAKSANGMIHCKWGGFIDDIDCFDPLFFKIAPRDAETIDPQERVFLEVVWETIEDAGYSPKSLAGSKHGEQRGDVAVFVGATNYAYPLLGEYETSQDEVQVPISLPWSIANRVSFALNFKGPSLPVDTACSSSLTAVHLACEYLREHDQAVAIAGGVNIYLHPSKYLWMCQMRMLALDGKCKSFGKNANGFVPGEGAGAMLLKTLDRAEADQDRIHAVIRGSSINHGGNTNGYTVPNPNAQEVLIRETLQKTNINPQSIGYVEAHGTGTALGDPIEITGLTKAFAADSMQGQYCAIGSVKSNIGHLEAAAGIAGITKIILQLRYKTLVPTLHCEVTNPNIRFEDTPFFLQKTLQPWSSSESGARRASISSFGAGGVNAHAIVEEYPIEQRDRQPDFPDLYVIVLSARTEDRLHVLANNLLAFVHTNLNSEDSSVGKIRLDDLAYTLQTGRETMEERLAFTAGSVNQLIEKLTGLREKKMNGIHRGSGGNSGKEQIQMGTRAGQEYLRITVEDREWEQLALLWVNGAEINWRLLYDQHNLPRRISLPAYPFAKKRYWIKRINRKRREETKIRLHPLLGENFSTFKKIEFQTTFTGKEFFLDAHRVFDEKILPGVASLEMARVAGQIAGNAQVLTIENMIWVKPVTVSHQGKSIAVQLTQHGQGGNRIDFSIHLPDTCGISTVFSKGILTTGAPLNRLQKGESLAEIRKRCTQSISSEACYKYFSRVGLNYGAAFRTIKELSWNDREAFARVCLPESIDISDRQWVLQPSLLDGALQSTTAFLQNKASMDRVPFLPFSLEKIEIFAPVINSCFVHVIRSQGDFGNNEIQKYHLRIFNDNNELLIKIHNFSARQLQQESTVQQGDASSLLYFDSTWEKVELLTGLPDSDKIAGATVLLFDFDRQLFEKLKNEFDTLILVSPGPFYQNVSPFHFEVALNSKDDYVALLRGLKDRNQLPDRVIFFWGKISEDKGWYSAQHLVDLTIGAITCLMQAWLESVQKTPLRILSLCLQNMPQCCPIQGGLAAFFRSVRKENSNLDGKVLRIESLNPNQIIHELFRDSALAFDIRYDNDERQSRNIIQVKEPALPQLDNLGENQTWLVTGGLGGLGYLFATHLAERYHIKLILWGRSENDEVKIKKLQILKGKAGAVLYQQVDLASEENIRSALATAKRKFGAIQGVLHCAGVIRDGLLQKKTDNDIKAVLEPKVIGTLILDELLRDEPLDHFILFSSIAGVFGNIGQSDYAFANSFMNSFAEQRQNKVLKGERAGKTISICWPLWKEGGMAVDEQSERLIEKSLGLRGLLSEEGIEAFYRMLVVENPLIGLVKGDMKKIQKKMEIRPLDYTTNSIKSSEKTLGRDLKLAPIVMQAECSNAKEWVEKRLKDILADVLKVEVDDLDSDEEMINYGLDSILMIRVLNLMEESFSEIFEPSILLDYNRIDTLTDRLLELGVTQLEEEADVHDSNAQEVVSGERFDASFGFQNVQETECSRSGSKKIAVIGYACRFPGSNDTGSFWQNLNRGKDLITEIPGDRWKWEDYYHQDRSCPGKSYSKWGGFIDNIYAFDAEYFGISETDAIVMDPHHRLILELSEELFHFSDYSKEALDGKRVRVIIGGGESHYLTRDLYGLQDRYTKHLVVNTIPNMMAARISDYYNLKGSASVVDTACSSSLVAVHEACKAILRGESEMAVAGGVELHLSPDSHIKFSKAEVLSSDSHSYIFDERADGFILGEGAGLVLLKDYERAVIEGDHICGIILSSCVNNDGRTIGLTVPNKEGQKEVIRQAIVESEIEPETISLLEAHGTGTLLGDPIEIQAITQVYREFTEKKQFCAVGSVKSNMGHLLRAGGVASLIKVLLALQHRTIPPTLNCEKAHPRFQFAESPFYPALTSLSWNPDCGIRRAAISSFGFGGTNCHLILEEAIQDEQLSVAQLQASGPEFHKRIYKLTDDEQSLTPDYLFRYNEPYVKAHEVFGEQILLGVTNCSIMIELALSLQKQGSPFRLQRFQLKEIVRLEENQSVNIRLYPSIPENDTMKLETRFRFSSANTEQQNTTSELQLNCDFNPPTIDPDLFIKKSQHRITKDHFLGKRLLDCPPCLQVVEKVYAVGNEFLGELKIHPEVKNASYPFRVHPAILNAGFITIMSFQLDSLLLQQDENAMWVPLFIKNLYVAEPLPESCYCYGKIDRITTDLLVLSYSLCNASGNVLVMVEEFTHKLIRRQDVQNVNRRQQVTKTVEARPKAKTIEQYLIDTLKQHINGKEITNLRDNFMALGLESHNMIHLTYIIEKEIGVELYPTLFFEYQNVESLATYLEREYSQAFQHYFDITVKDEVAPEPTNVSDIIEENITQQIDTVEQAASHRQKHDNAVAVIGMASRFAESATAEEFWDHLVKGHNLISEIPESHWDWRQWYDADREAVNKTYCKWGSFIEVDRFDPIFFGITPREAVWLDPQLRLLLETTHGAIEDAGYGKSIKGTRTGVFVGASLKEYWDEIVKRRIPFEDHQASSGLLSTLPGRVSFTFDLRGPSIPVDTACSSSLMAVHLACRALNNKDCDMAIAAGVGILISPLHYLYVSRMQAFSATGQCHSFDEKADGYVPGEGVGVLLLKPLQRALEAHDQIHSIILGSAINHVGHANNPTSPRTELQTELLLQAWENAGINPETITHIEAHGTGTVLGDPVEINALIKAFQQHTAKTGFCAIGTAKTNLGHLGSAAGMAGVVKGILSIKHRKIPVMPTFKKLNPYIDLSHSPLYIPEKLTDWTTESGIPRRMGISAFGIAGSNAHVVLEEPPRALSQKVVAAEVLLLFSARDEGRLFDYLRLFQRFLEKQTPSLYQMSYTLMEGREAMNTRIAVIVSSHQELRQKLREILNGGREVTYFSSIENDTNKKGIKEASDTGEGFRYRDLSKLAQCWVNGGEVKWLQLEPKRVEPVSLPTYPFAREKYWATCLLEELADKSTQNSNAKYPDMGSSFYFLPVWRRNELAAPPLGQNKAARVLLVNPPDELALTAAFKAHEAVAEIRELQIDDQNSGLQVLEELMMENTDIDEIVFLGGITNRRFSTDNANQVTIRKRGLYSLLNLLQIFARSGKSWENIRLKIVTNKLFQVRSGEEIRPECAELWGLAKTFAAEHPGCHLALLDIDFSDLYSLTIAQQHTLGDFILREPCQQEQLNGVAIRSGLRFALDIDPVDLVPFEQVPLKKNGTYVILGGKGRVGLKLVEMLFRDYAARLIIVGRHPLSSEKRSKLNNLKVEGASITYLQADITDIQSIRTAVGQVKKDYGRIDGYIHAAVVEKNALIQNHDWNSFDIGLQAKVQGSLCLAEVLREESPDFLLFFSSSQSFIAQPGMSSYVAGNCFQDAFASYLNNKVDYPVRTINWGVWNADYDQLPQISQRSIESMGFRPIDPEKAMDAILVSLSRKHVQLIAIEGERCIIDKLGSITDKINYHFSEPVPVEEFTELKNAFLTMRSFAGEMLLGFFQKNNLLVQSGEVHTITSMKSKLKVVQKYNCLFAELIRILVEYEFVEWVEGMIRSTLSVERHDLRKRLKYMGEERKRIDQSYPGVKAYTNLVWICLEKYGDILNGNLTATELIFPEYSMERVDGIYRNNPKSNYYNRLCQTCLKELLKNRKISNNENGKIRIIEIGAGTGGTSRTLLQALRNFQHQIEYVYTDVSPGFIRYGKNQYAADFPFVTFQVLDIEKNIQEKAEIVKGSFDIAIATNVLHATRNMETTLKNVKSLLKGNGMVIINESTSIEECATLTFGLLDGWWLFDDDVNRIQGAPLLSQQNWNCVLKRAGFLDIQFWGQELCSTESGMQNVIVAENNVAENSAAKNNESVVIAEMSSVQKRKVVNGQHQVRELENYDTRERIEAQVCRIIAETIELPITALDLEASFSSLGVDSILSLEIVKLINQRLHLDLGSTIVFHHSTIQLLIDHIVESYDIEGLKVECSVADIHSDSTDSAQSFHPILEKNEQDNEYIAVIGMSGRFPGAETLEEFWQNLTQGKDCVGEISRWKLADFYDEDPQVKNKSNSKWAGLITEIEQFDPLFFGISPKEAEYMDPQQRLFLQESWKALEDAGYSDQDLENMKCSVFVGFNASDYHRVIDRQGFVCESQRLTGNYEAMLSSRLSYFLNMHGSTLTINTACSSSLVALHLACENLRKGVDEMAIAGGVTIMNTPEFFILLSTTDVLSRSGCCRAFDNKADGISLGEGVGCVVLKKMDAARRDGDHIYGIIVGSGINNDGKTNGITAPSALAQTSLAEDVYKRFQIDPSQISYVEAHGTGTRMGDPIEIEALSDAWRLHTSKTNFCAIGSLKSNIGHTMAASGIAGLMKVMFCLHYRKLVPSLHFDEPNQLIDFRNSPFFVNTSYRDWETENAIPRMAAISSFGFSGTNAHVVVRQSPFEIDMPNAITVDEQLRLIVVCAKTEESLRRKIVDLINWLETHADSIFLRDLAYTLLIGRSHFRAVFAFPCNSIEGAIQGLKKGLQAADFHIQVKRKKLSPSIIREGEQIIESLVAGKLSQEKMKEKMELLAKLFRRGIPLDWKRLFLKEQPNRLSLPTYPFARENYWAGLKEIDQPEFYEPQDTSRDDEVVYDLMKKLELGDISTEKAMQIMEDVR